VNMMDCDDDGGDDGDGGGGFEHRDDNDYGAVTGIQLRVKRRRTRRR